MDDVYIVICYNNKTKRMKSIYEDIHDWNTALLLAKVAMKEKDNDDNIIFVAPGYNNMSKAEYDEAKKTELVYRKRE